VLHGSGVRVPKQNLARPQVLPPVLSVMVTSCSPRAGSNHWSPCNTGGTAHLQYVCTHHSVYSGRFRPRLMPQACMVPTEALCTDVSLLVCHRVWGDVCSHGPRPCCVMRSWWPSRPRPRGGPTERSPAGSNRQAGSELGCKHWAPQQR
jgi:hypothetical protein